MDPVLHSDALAPSPSNSPQENDMILDNDIDEDKGVAIISPDESMDEAEPEPKLRADDYDAIMKRHMPPISDLETECETHHTWDIENWRALGRREQGPTFKCGEHPFRVLFFPYGNNVDHASFYLEHGFGDKVPEDWYACAQFTLVLWNPNDPTLYHTHTATHRFQADESDWGFTRFAELRKLFAPRWEDSDRPMVENDSAKLTAYVRVYKDPTGVLWHNFVNYDSKKVTGMVGLKNQGATCYLNSLLQSLYFTTAFRKAVYQIPTENETDVRANSAYALQRLFYQLQTSAVAVSTGELTKAFGWDTRQIFEQQDVQELSRILMERLEEKMKGSEAQDALAKMFVGKMKTYISCINVDYESSRTEDFWDIQLNVSGNNDLDDSFRDYIQVETMEGENKYQAEGFGLQDAKKGVIFESFPSVLHLQLKRFEYDIQRDAMTKINDRYEFPEEWDASPYLSQDADRSEPYIYQLYGVLVHSGDLNAGHYYAFIKPQKDSEFFKFDDDRVMRALKREAISDNFGGEAPAQANGQLAQRNPYTRVWSAKRSNNAYMLVYIRQSRTDSILLNEDEVQPPEHLARKFAEEKALNERIRKDREEAHLYMQINVAANSNFKEHQGFDIVPWKDSVEASSAAIPKSYRILRCTTVDQFVKFVAADLEVDPETLRPWAMVNRQNGTVRPDRVIAEPHITVEEALNKYGTKTANLRLWMEDAVGKDDKDKPVFGDAILESRVPLDPSNRPIILFLKYFDIEKQTLYGVSHFYAAQQDRVSDISPQIFKLMGWPADTAFKVFEEIKHSMIEPMKPKQTLAQSEIQDGDIITVQKHISEKEAAAVTERGGYAEAREFYEYLLHRIAVKFVPKVSAEAEGTTFELVLSKRMTYNQLAQKVGEHLGEDPTHLRFTPVNATNGKPKAVAVRHTTNNNLGAILSPGYNSYGAAVSQRPDALFYEVLEVSLSELEMRKNIKVTWLPEGLTKEEHFEFLVPKNGTIQNVVLSLQRKVPALTDEIFDRIRVFEVHNNKIYRECSPNYAIANLTDFVNLFIEIKPEEEIDYPEGDHLALAFHFEKEVSRAHGIPFVFLMKKGETFKETKERLSRRTGLKGKSFEKIRFAVIPRSNYQRPLYLEDDDILSEKLSPREDQLGLDHANKARSAWNRADSIFIR
ncbi:ubiquitin carboxyl-terminal hydrolase 21 [Trichodelitschia bisporula]|uniref:ubiquitinyl hydrolase 1 n=1 Tax=Trichodelitschia bisporula TaxID=703511 RepID=A0A6G1I3Z1_9PEZI|nr:ubiquitin carboxyl-terminal hydrolase 21 [Trichodelitschia bisporula]